MGRLIDVQPAGQGFASRLVIAVGDLLMFGASGGHVRSGGGAVELLGMFRTGVVGAGGTVLSPVGAPGTVLFLARHPGEATIDVVTGDPWRESRTSTVHVVVQP